MKLSSRQRLTRRDLVRVVGSAAFVLPALELLEHESRAQTVGKSKYVVFCYTPDGVNHAQFWPTGSTSSYTLSPILTPFQAYKDKLLVIGPQMTGGKPAGNTGLTYAAATPQHQAPVTLAARIGNLPYTNPQTSAVNRIDGPSIDQVIAKAVKGTSTPAVRDTVAATHGKGNRPRQAVRRDESARTLLVGSPVTQVLKNAARLLLLCVAYVAFFALGGTVFAPAIPSEPGAQNDGALRGILIMSLVDCGLVLALVRTSRWHGLRLMAMVSGLFYGIKTLTSQIEAAYFMPNVTLPMLPGLLLMTLPLAAVLGPLAVLMGGRLRRAPGQEHPPWTPPSMTRPRTWITIGVLSAFVYPALFFLAGWFIAFRSPAVRDFYGNVYGTTFLEQMLGIFRHSPDVYALEVARGALWIAMALPVLRSTRGPWWVGTLQVALWFSLVQNDVHLFPNPFMNAEIRLYHFVETASSNFVWAWIIGWSLRPKPVRA